jgi:YggT family protein
VAIAQLLDVVFDLYMIVLLARVIVSWVQFDPRNPLVEWVYRLTEPVLAPIRSVLPAMGGLDFSPVVAMLLLSLLKRILLGL